MASIGKFGDKWRAQIARDGVRKSKVFATKREAADWAARQEYLIKNKATVTANITFKELMERYAREVSPAKQGHRWEAIRIRKFQRHDIAKIKLGKLCGDDFGKWRDQRLGEVKPGSVIREMALLGAILNKAAGEWQMLAKSPMKHVSKPRKPPRRSRRPSKAELKRLSHSAGGDLSKATARAFHAFKFAIETGMRAGEIVGLTHDNVDLKRRVAHLPKTKNGEPRDVALSKKAIKLIKKLPDYPRVFGLNSIQLDVLWRKLRDRAAVADLTFHDSRHEAITRLSKKIEILELAKMVGHRDLNMLLIYYEDDAESVARKLG